MLDVHPSVTDIWLLAISADGQLYCCSNSLGAKLPWRLLLAPVFNVIENICIAYARINANLTTCDVDTSEPDGAGLSCESGDEERADSHFDGSQRGAVQSSCLRMLRRGSRSEQQQRGDDD